MKVGKVTVAIDGTKILTNASKHSAVSCAKAGEMMQELDLKIAELLKKSEMAGLDSPTDSSGRTEFLRGSHAPRISAGRLIR